MAVLGSAGAVAVAVAWPVVVLAGPAAVVVGAVPVVAVGVVAVVLVAVGVLEPQPASTAARTSAT